MNAQADQIIAMTMPKTVVDHIEFTINKSAHTVNATSYGYLNPIPSLKTKKGK